MQNLYVASLVIFICDIKIKMRRLVRKLKEVK